jgi:hypothetical protein
LVNTGSVVEVCVEREPSKFSGRAPAGKAAANARLAIASRQMDLRMQRIPFRRGE